DIQTILAFQPLHPRFADVSAQTLGDPRGGQCPLVREMMKQRAFGQPGLGNDPPKSGTRITQARKFAVRSVQNRPSCLLRLFSPTFHARSYQPNGMTTSERQAPGINSRSPDGTRALQPHAPWHPA